MGCVTSKPVVSICSPEEEFAQFKANLFDHIKSNRFRKVEALWEASKLLGIHELAPLKKECFKLAIQCGHDRIASLPILNEQVAELSSEEIKKLLAWGHFTGKRSETRHMLLGEQLDSPYEPALPGPVETLCATCPEVLDASKPDSQLALRFLIRYEKFSLLETFLKKVKFKTSKEVMCLTEYLPPTVQTDQKGRLQMLLIQKAGQLLAEPSSLEEKEEDDYLYLFHSEEEPAPLSPTSATITTTAGHLPLGPERYSLSFMQGQRGDVTSTSVICTGLG